MDTLKRTAGWTGIVVVGLCGIVLLGGGKIMSGTLLIATTFLMVSPLWRHRAPLWVRAGLLCCVLGSVVWNISTTELPEPDGVGGQATMVNACITPAASTFGRTGIGIVDRAAYIFAAFLDQAQFS